MNCGLATLEAVAHLVADGALRTTMNRRQIIVGPKSQAYASGLLEFARSADDLVTGRSRGKVDRASALASEVVPIKVARIARVMPDAGVGWSRWTSTARLTSQQPHLCFWSESTRGEP